MGNSTDEVVRGATGGALRQEGTRAGSEGSLARLVIVAMPAYGIQAVALAAAWKYRWEWVTVAVILITASMAVLMCTEFSTFRAVGAGIRFEAERQLKRVQSRSSRGLVKRGQKVAAEEVPLPKGAL